MTHLGFIATSYGLTVLVAAIYGADAWLRMHRARRRLAAIDPRASRP